MGNDISNPSSTISSTIYYAVKKEKRNIGIFHRWEEFQKNAFGQSGLHMRSFDSLPAAQQWLRKSRVKPQIRKRKRHISRTPTRHARTDPAVAGLSDDEVDGSSDDIESEERRVALSLHPSQSPRTPNKPSTSPHNPFQPPSPPPPDVIVSPSSPTDNLETGHLDESVDLSSEQEAVFNKVKAGHSIFFTGAAGTGKSFLLRKIVQWARYTYGDSRVGVAASTGLAAINIGGSTVFSWAGIGVGKKSHMELLSMIKNASWMEDPKTGEWSIRTDSPLMRWMLCDLLILDEVSMINGELIDKLDWIGRQIRDEDKPWGNIQMVFCGDFFQLPPVADRVENVVIPASLAFDSISWSKTVGKPIVLKKVFRQDDSEFVNMLNALRIGVLNEDHVLKFKALDREIVCPEGMEPLQLFPRKDYVNNANRERLTQLKGEAEEFRSIDHQGWTSKGCQFPMDIFQAALTRMVALGHLSLKVGSQVMLIKNLVAGSLVNGSMGKVVGFRRAKEAYEDRIDFALPQCLNSWSKNGGKPRQEDPPDEVLASEICWPLVKFTKSGRTLLCVPTSFETVNACGEVEAIRFQIPIIPAWAMSVHKSQGMTIDYLKVDLAGSFECGQVYVALSRASSREGLQVCNFDPSGVMTHPRVIEWMRDEQMG